MFAPAAALKLDDSQRKRIEFLVRSGKTPRKIAERAQVIWLAAQGKPNSEIARELRISRPKVLRWRERFEICGVQGLYQGASRPGRKGQSSEETEKKIVELTLHSKPENATHWSCRTLAKKAGVCAATVNRVWRRHRLQPHRVETFKLSRDKQFVEKVRDVVGLYLNPPDRALVLSVDEKSQIQALDRTQPGLPLKKGRCETMTHDYKRNGTTTLFAALNMLDGTVIGKCMPRHRSKEFIKFLEYIDGQTPVELDLHLIVDNYGTHKSPPVKRWLKKHPRFHLHFIPTSSSWLNMVERWFREITDKRIRRGVFQSVPQLIAEIERYLETHNADPKIFTWTKDAETILAKVERAKARIVTL
jgi:transposase